MQEIFAHIDRNAEAYLAQLRTLCQQPSISAQNVGMEQTAAMVHDMLQQIGAQAQIFSTAGFPIVYGRLPGRSSKRLALYNHYDVQPPDPLDQWDSDPFAAELRDGRIWARGVADNKGNLVARLCAVDAYRQVRGELPLTVLFIFEGEEEIGSPSLGPFAEAHRDLLAADGCIWEAGYKDDRGRPSIYLGLKGDCYVELRATGASTDLHSSWGTVVPNPIWRLAWALNTLKDDQERILIPGFYDQVREPTAPEIEALRNLAFDEQGIRRRMGLPHFLNHLSGLPLLIQHLYQPTCTVCGIVGGYTGSGAKTVLPHQASLKLDMRLVPDQDPDQIYDQLCRHLQAQGFGDIEVEHLSGSHPAQTALDDPLARAVEETARQVYDQPPVVYPRMAGSGPMYDLCQRFGIPAVSTGVGNAASHNHAPNENIYVADFIQGIKHIAAIIAAYA